MMNFKKFATFKMKISKALLTVGTYWDKTGCCYHKAN